MDFKKEYLIYPILGIIVGLSTVFLIPAYFEMFIWLFLISGIGYTTFRNNSSNQIFWKAVTTGVFITFTHLVFLEDYLLTHPDDQKLITDMGLESPYLSLLLIAPLYWLAVGLFTRLSAYFWRKSST